MAEPILHSRLPHAPWLDPVTWRLPGTRPVDPAEWLIRDEAFGGQMALRDRLIEERPDEVHACPTESLPAARETLELACDALAQDSGYSFGKTEVRRPDGVSVPLDRDRPLVTLGRLQQADVCLMERGPEGHLLSAAVLCFPASWTLSEKLGRPMTAIHGPVREYDEDLTRRVQRLFDALRPGTVLSRANALLYETADLFAPRSESAPPRRTSPEAARYLRSERQTLRALPKTGAIVFTIHTVMIPVSALNVEQREGLHLLKRH